MNTCDCGFSFATTFGNENPEVNANGDGKSEANDGISFPLVFEYSEVGGAALGIESEFGIPMESVMGLIGAGNDPRTEPDGII